MGKRVLDVGQCSPDHHSIKSLIKSLGAEIRRCEHPDEAIQILRENRYDLVLVNRKIDMDYSDGIHLIRMMKVDPATKEIPVMMVTNFTEYQDQAVDVGAVRGFGKDDLHSSSTRELLSNFL